MRITLLTILCAVLAVASSEPEPKPCRSYITANMTLDWERYAKLKTSKEKVRDRLSWVTETSRPNKTSENCEYWLKIDDPNVREINKNAFDNLMIDGLEIVDKSSVVFLTVGSFNGLPSLRHLEIRPPILIMKVPLPEHPIDHELSQDTTNLSSLEFGSSDQISFNKMLKQFPKLKSLIINFTPKLNDQPKSHLNIGTFVAASESITHLEFTNSQMLSIQSKTFFRFKNLTHLKFNNMGLRYLSPNSFRDLAKLEYLSFTTAYSFKVRRHTFDSFAKLNTLVMRGCVSSIENKAFAGLSVEFMDLSCNKIIVIKDQIFYRINATHFDLSFNEIKRIHKDSFAHSNIKYLYLWNTGLNSTHVDKPTWGLPESTVIIFDRPSNHSVTQHQSCPPEKPFEFN